MPNIANISTIGHYEIEVVWSDNGGLPRTYATVYADTVDNEVQHPSSQDAAIALRDWYATQPGYVSSTVNLVATSVTPV